MELSNLLSGLIGAIIGGLFSYFGSIKATEKSIKAVYEQEAQKQKKEEEKAKESAIKRLLAEVKENLLLADEARISHAKIRFLTEIWSSVKGNLSSLKEDLQENLQKAYVQIHRYNVLADYDQEKIQYGGGYLDDAISNQAQKVKEALLPCKEGLEALKQLGN